MLPNLAATFSSLASSVFSDFGLAGHSCLFDASSFLGFSAIFHWFSSSQLLFSACFSCSSSFFWSVSMENCTALPEGLLSFSLCFLLSWPHSRKLSTSYDSSHCFQCQRLLWALWSESCLKPTLGVPQAPQPQHLELSFRSPSSAQPMTHCLPSCSNQRSILPSFLHSSLIQSSSSAKMLLSLTHQLFFPPSLLLPPQPSHHLVLPEHYTSPVCLPGFIHVPSLFILHSSQHDLLKF